MVRLRCDSLALRFLCCVRSMICAMLWSASRRRRRLKGLFATAALAANTN